ncbi:MAG: 3-dehydroquinate synthase [Nitrospirota bacterium]|nr:MAG: 3-dehydroquinate synthase [Nitrospirota bacterium]
MKIRAGFRPRLQVPVSLGDRSYDIIIQEDLLQEAGSCLQQAGLSGRVGVVTNPQIGKLYGRQLSQSLKKAGFPSTVIVIPEGEQAKTLKWASKILDELVTGRFERNDLLLALGGGVIGDITGFAASIYLRGMPFVQMATTLIAQVDSSVGGKTGVNHPLGKNLIGSFYQPRLVLMDTATLRTLPKREWIAGLAEVIKYGMIADRSFFEYLERHMDAILRMETEPIQFLIKRCCEIKASVVGSDERESGLRRILNYGHTIGHALESLGKYKKLIHGEAVGIGMVHEAALSYNLEYCSEEVVHRQRALVRRAGLPDQLPSLKISDLWGAMQHDKKVVKGQVYCVFPKDIGQVAVLPLARTSVTAWYRSSKRGKGNAPPGRGLHESS